VKGLDSSQDNDKEDENMLRKTLVMWAALMFATAVSGQAQDMMKGETMKAAKSPSKIILWDGGK